MTRDLSALIPEKPRCSVEGCSNVARTKGLCARHYTRAWKYGHPTATMYRAKKYFEEVVLTYTGDDCIFWPLAKTVQGYGVVRFRGKQTLVSRAVCVEMYGDPPSPCHQAAHSCGNGHLGCVNPKHLRWATPRENQADRLRHGTVEVGESNSQAKLTEQDILDIREARNNGVHLKNIAARFHVCIQTISNICHRKTWGHVR